jgi:hypothetical protein
MKSLTRILFLPLAIASLQGEPARLPQAGAAGITITGFPAEAVAAFEKSKEHYIKVESGQAVRLYGKEKLSTYLDYFKKGMESETGAIMIEGEENQWLEVAFSRGYYTRMFFISGFLEGLSHQK